MKIGGIGASDGITIHKVFKLEDINIQIPETKIDNIEDEKDKLTKALAKSEQELTLIREKILNDLDEEHAMIFDAHIQIVNDSEIASQVNSLIENDQTNAAFAFDKVCRDFSEIFKAMDNEYMRERAADVLDVSKRVVGHILGITQNDASLIDEEVIVVARDLTPSDTAQLNKKYVKGFITNIGGKTSHSAIMARSLEIPAIVGAKNITSLVENDELVILDGINGTIIVKPTEEEIRVYQNMQKEFELKVKVWQKYKDKTTTTLDEHQVELVANIGSPADLDAVIQNGAEGIGLYRTEFLYMNNDHLPTLEEQYEAYRKVVSSLPNKKVIIRTLDIGGDKQLDYLPLGEELNPFLGHRALRLCLERTDIFKTQLKALLKASIHGDLHIMFPMVATLDELREAKVILEESKNELKANNESFGDPKVGIMVEIPAVAILADQFAKEVDFFSIGTNDLIQYSFAADRMNEKVAYLYQPYNPSLLRLIKMVIDASHEHGIWTGMCGEMAGDEIAAPILLGLGLDEFSMSATSILRTRHLLSKLSYKEMQKQAETVLNYQTNNQVKEHIEKMLKENE